MSTKDGINYFRVDLDVLNKIPDTNTNALKQLYEYYCLSRLIVFTDYTKFKLEGNGADFIESMNSELMDMLITIQSDLLTNITLFSEIKNINDEFFQNLIDISTELNEDQAKSFMKIYDQLVEKTSSAELVGGAKTDVLNFVMKLLIVLILVLNLNTVSSDLENDYKGDVLSLDDKDKSVVDVNVNTLFTVKYGDKIALPQSFKTEKAIKLSKMNFLEKTIKTIQGDQKLINLFTATVDNINNDFQNTYKKVETQCKQIVKKSYDAGLLDTSITSKTEDEKEATEGIITSILNSGSDIFGYASSLLKSDSKEVKQATPSEETEGKETKPTTVASKISGITNELANNIVNNNIQTNKIVSSRISENLLRVCSAIFEPTVEIQSVNNNLFIAKSVQGNMAANGITNFENFRSILEFYRKEIDEKSSGFDPDNAEELKDLKQKINILEEIVNNSLNELKPFNTEEQFNRQMEDLNMNLDEIKNLSTLFLRFKPEDVRKNIVSSERELQQQLDSANKALKEAKTEEDIQNLESEKSQIETQIKLKQAEDISQETEAQTKLIAETTKSYTAPVTTTLKIGAQEVFNFASDVGVSGVNAINNFTDSIGDLLISLVSKFGFALTIIAGSSALLLTCTIGLYTYYKILGYSKNFKNKPAENQETVVVSKTTPNTIISSEVDKDNKKGKVVTGIFTCATKAETVNALKNMNDYFISKQETDRIILYNIQSRGIFAECAKYLGLNTKTPTEVIIQFVDRQSKTKKIRQFSFDYNAIIDPTIDANTSFYEARIKQCKEKLQNDGVIEKKEGEEEDVTPVFENEVKNEEGEKEEEPKEEEPVKEEGEKEEVVTPVTKIEDEPVKEEGEKEEDVTPVTKIDDEPVKEEIKEEEPELEEGEIKEETGKGGKRKRTNKSNKKNKNKTVKKRENKKSKKSIKKRKNRNHKKTKKN